PVRPKPAPITLIVTWPLACVLARSAMAVSRTHHCAIRHRAIAALHTATIARRLGACPICLPHLANGRCAGSCTSPNSTPSGRTQMLVEEGKRHWPQLPRILPAGNRALGLPHPIVVPALEWNELRFDPGGDEGLIEPLPLLERHRL